MTAREFVQSLANGRVDILQLLLAILKSTGTDYCLIGGLAVNAYVEPVVSLDIDVVVAVQKTEAVRTAAEAQGLKVEVFPHSINLTGPGSDLRIQLQTDPRYQAFVSTAETRIVLGYELKVATLGDVLQGKVWAYLDDTRRRSKRQKDLADIARLTEAHPELLASLPGRIKDQLA
ncbi:MAG: hypothetical protein AB1806_14135 [Acidobacteriota bacterium]